MHEFIRYIPTFALIINNQLKPIWELEYVNHDDYGEGYNHKDDKNGIHYRNLVDCYWDTKDKLLITGIKKDVYPQENDFKIGENVMVETHNKHKYLFESTINEIVFEDYDIRVVKVKSLESYELNEYFTPEEQKTLNKDDIYEIRSWKPTYVLSTGQKINWSHQLYHKVLPPQ